MLGSLSDFHWEKSPSIAGGSYHLISHPGNLTWTLENRPETQKRKDRLPTIFQGRSVKFSGAYHLFHHLFEVDKR